ncbi:MAG: response regulator [Thermoguttaceae bacterium]|jgi:CheY-like chemotaxis protein
MTNVLVVDDSVVDRAFVGGVLAKIPDLKVEYAVHGAEALAKMEHALPELVITDLLMPQMDGLQLVSIIQRSYPQVPVILMTSQGSEETAVRALQLGAASYVPKRLIARDLPETIRKVILVSTQQRGQRRLMGCMTHSESTFVLGNDASLFGPLIEYLQDSTVRMGLCNDADRTRVGVALEEALANALFHGNLEAGSELREQDAETYYTIIETRRQQVPYKDRLINVEARLGRDEAIFVIADSGTGFDPASLPDPTDPVNLEKASGRGILLMRTFMDEVRYSPAGNQVTLVKRRRTQAPQRDQEQP